MNVLKEFPNWAYALDEEGEEGQDETTIKPQDQQTYISSETDFTVADAIVSSGESCPAMLSLLDGTPESVDFYDGQQWWSIRHTHGRRWSFSGTDDDGGRKKLPVRIVSRLPLPSDEKISFTINADGTSDMRKSYL